MVLLPVGPLPNIEVLFCYRFNRILALPSDNWLDGSESWWCHGGGGHCHSASETCSSTAHDVELSLSMKPQDCLVGDSCLVVADEALIGGSCLSVDSHLVQCHRCLNVVGRDLNAGIHHTPAFSFCLLEFVTLKPVGVHYQMEGLA
jgi:HECT-like Ubiquitin-conjugating enzyme (E2)-binding